MDNDTQALAGCLTVLALLILAPFVIMATPVLLGAALGALAFWLLMLLIAAVAGVSSNKPAAASLGGLSKINSAPTETSESPVWD